MPNKKAKNKKRERIKVFINLNISKEPHYEVPFSFILEAPQSEHHQFL